MPSGGWIKAGLDERLPQEAVVTKSSNVNHAINIASCPYDQIGTTTTAPKKIKQGLAGTAYLSNLTQDPIPDLPLVFVLGTYRLDKERAILSL